MQDPIQQVKDAADIVELISEIIPVKRSGSSYLALCPFHNDSKPSMHISPTKGIFKCFACGVGGDVFKFWSEYYQKDFKETLKDLAEKYGVEISFQQEDKKKIEIFNLKIKMHELAAEYYFNQLQASSEAQVARAYLDKRNISTVTISKFKLGYAPKDSENWGKLIQVLKDKLSVSDDEIVNAGLALKSEKNGRYYDRFRGRLMIPIFDERSRIVAFGARALSDEDQPKYLNSPDTDTYHKSSILYGINFAKDSIRKNDSVILVEGYFDVISLQQAGIDNVVANNGTALTTNQIKLLGKFTEAKNIFLCFDSDTAGEQALDRAAELISQVFTSYDHTVYAVRIPGDKDADDYVQEHSVDEFRALCKNSKTFYDYKINLLIDHADLNSPESKAKTVKQLAKYLFNIKNKIILDGYINLLTEKLKIDRRSLEAELRDIMKDTTSQPKDLSPSRQRLKLDKAKVNGHIIYTKDSLYVIEQEIIIQSLLNKSFMERFMQEDGVLISKSYNEILQALIEISFEHYELNDAEMKFNLLNERLNAHRDLSSELAELGIKLESFISNNQNQDDSLKALVKRLRILKIEKEFRLIKEKEQASSPNNPEFFEIIKEKSRLQKELHSLKAPAI
jgi:DNA primase